MSKYEPLGAFLQSKNADVVPITFAQIERLIGAKLPPSAKYRAWWSNNPDNSVMTRVWLEAGFRSEEVDLNGRKLVFRRVRDKEPEMQSDPIQKTAASSGKHPLFGALKGLLRVMPGTDLTQPADPDWGARS